ncbi:carboxypeptidase-like regulatory domain-containing protein [uncultured Gimesia sp.]|uniref:carboxypeptidase-like regulatory domain-containing protein n=1 Tax=uncultured Gimesia sp. TaxID=1678688 RepID=UPI0030DB511A|tara:strand:+ start:6259 stop:6726 length:468 start_codon:yes stop_codon:yes gene_type:complete
MHVSKLSFCLFCLVGLILTGCGSENTNLPELTPVNGTVTLNGDPASGVTIILYPQQGTNGNAPKDTAFGISDENGHYAIKHRSGAEGVEPGQYVVTFSKMVMPDGSTMEKGAEPAAVGARELLPKQYTNPQRTKENVTVQKTQDTYDFALKAKKN